MTWYLAPEAEAGLDEALAYLAARNPPAAGALLGRVLAALDRLDAAEINGREVHLQSGAPVRRWVVAPLVIFYERSARGLEVLHIRHGARAPIAT